MFRNLNRPRAAGCYIQFEFVRRLDEITQPTAVLFQDTGKLDADKKRLQHYLDGHWHFQTIAARANILFSDGNLGTLAFIETAGASGIPSDWRATTERAYQRELAKLKRMLESLQNYTDETPPRM